MFARHLSVLLLSLVVLLSSCTSFYGNLVQNQRQQLETLTTALSQVNSKESADAIVPQVTQYGNGLTEVVKGLSSSGKPSYLEMYRMYSQLKDEETKTAALAFAMQYGRLEAAQYYGSQELKDSLYNEMMRVAASYGQ